MPDPGSRTRKAWWRRLLPLAVIAVFCAALWALDREINRFHLADFLAYLRELAWWKLALAVAATAAGYAILIGYDWFALRYVHHHLALRRVAFTAFIGYAFSLNIGQTVLSGGAVRMRLYTRWGLGPGDVTRIMGFNYVIGLVGQLLLAGLLFVLVGVRLPDYLPAPFRSVTALGVAALVVVGLFAVLIARKREVIRIRNWRLELPPPGLALPAVLNSAIEWAVSGSVLYLLMPSGSAIGLLPFLGMVMLAHILSVLSMVPGGLGVFETIIIHLLPESVPQAGALSALIAFRAIYFLAPFLIAIVLFGVHEILQRRKR